MVGRAFILLFCLIIVCVNLGSATLWCYSCYTYTGHGEACQVNVNNRTVQIISCPYNYPTCLTVVANGTIRRACGWQNACAYYHNYTMCSTCSHNLCNSYRYNKGFVPSHSVSAGLSIALFAIMKLFV